MPHRSNKFIPDDAGDLSKRGLSLSTRVRHMQVEVEGTSASGKEHASPTSSKADVNPTAVIMLVIAAVLIALLVAKLI